MAQFSGSCCSSANILFQKVLEKGVPVQQIEAAPESKPVSVMYTGGTIRPLKCGNVYETVEAIGFHDGKVVAAGSKEDVTACMSRQGEFSTQHLKQGHAMLPGFIDPHLHIVLSGALKGSEMWNDFGPFDEQELRNPYNPDYLSGKIKDVKERLASSANSDPVWILGYGVDPSLMPLAAPMELVSFNCDGMDKLESEAPVFMLSASLHTAYINKAAACALFQLMKTNDKPVMTLEHDEIKTEEEYYEYVNLIGGLQQMEMIIPALESLPQPSPEDVVKGINSIFETAVHLGITMLYDAAMKDKMLTILEAICNPHGGVRVGYARLCESWEKVDALDCYTPPSESDEFYNLYAGSVKIMSDGSNQGLTGYQSEKYRCKADPPLGVFDFEMDTFLKMVKLAIEKKWPLMIHANGDKAIDNVIEAYRNALGCEFQSGLAKRHRIEHCSLPTEKALDEMFELGLSPSFLIGHVGYWGHVFKKTIFEEKALRLDPCQSALRRDMRISLHSDHTVTELGPLRMMEQAITRIMEQDPNKEVLNEDEKLTPAQALKAVTYDAAWHCHADKWMGSLEEGKLADYVILREDPITRKSSVGLRDIDILETWIGGVQAYKFEQK